MVFLQIINYNHPFSGEVDYDWLSLKIINVNLSIKKIHPFSNKVDSWLSFRIKNINLIIKKIYLSLGKVTNLRYSNVRHKLVTRTSE